MGVEDWANGSAEYYIMRDGSFGAAGPLSDFFLSITFTPWGTLIGSAALVANTMRKDSGEKLHRYKVQIGK